MTFIIINGFSVGDQQISKYRKVMQLGTTSSRSFLITFFKTHMISEVHVQLRAYSKMMGDWLYGKIKPR